ncbi:MAG: radical SAM protein, partial [Candidatus Pacebacteria bacterium]|nr:radical SAM protein [Candidatus Paceibacterota bacterium]
MKIKEIQSRSAINKCGFPGGGLAINPYIGCSHGCCYCYARFMKRFTNHKEDWGTFVDVKTNIVEILKKQLSLVRYKEPIFIGTVTDPYQSLEEKYKLTKNILEVL